MPAAGAPAVHHKAQVRVWVQPGKHTAVVARIQIAVAVRKPEGLRMAKTEPASGEWAGQYIQPCRIQQDSIHMAEGHWSAQDTMPERGSRDEHYTTATVDSTVEHHKLAF